MLITKKQLKDRFESATKVVEKVQEKMEYSKRITDERYNKAVVKADKCARLLSQMRREKIGKILF